MAVTPNCGMNHKMIETVEKQEGVELATSEEPEGSWSNLSNADDSLAMLNSGYNGASETGLSQDNMVLTAQSKWLIIDPSY